MSSGGLKWLAVAATVLGLGGSFVVASDHDDGVTAAKEKNLNLTDLYVFREDNQSNEPGDSRNLIFIMNSNPRAIGGQQEYFNERGIYEFHVSRVRSGDKNTTPTGISDFVLRFEFGEPDENQRQPITITSLSNGRTIAGIAMDEDKQLMTTSRADSLAGNIRGNGVKLGTHELRVFAGLREDPFFLDVDQFFKVRAGAAGLGPKVGFKPAEEAVDFTVGYNVNSIVVRLPIELLQTEAGEPIFDVWEIVKVKE